MRHLLVEERVRVYVQVHVLELVEMVVAVVVAVGPLVREIVVRIVAVHARQHVLLGVELDVQDAGRRVLQLVELTALEVVVVVQQVVVRHVHLHVVLVVLHLAEGVLLDVEVVV